jgi:hypothetical protein
MLERWSRFLVDWNWQNSMRDRVVLSDDKIEDNNHEIYHFERKLRKDEYTSYIMRDFAGNWRSVANVFGRWQSFRHRHLTETWWTEIVNAALNENCFRIKFMIDPIERWNSWFSPLLVVGTDFLKFLEIGHYKKVENSTKPRLSTLEYRRPTSRATDEVEGGTTNKRKLQWSCTTWTYEMVDLVRWEVKMSALQRGLTLLRYSQTNYFTRSEHIPRQAIIVVLIFWTLSWRFSSHSRERRAMILWKPIRELSDYGISELYTSESIA